jgi:hypothetical protein
MKKQSLSRSAADYASVRLGLALLLAVPLAVMPFQNEGPAKAVIPDSVAFSQAGVTAAPTEWANRILVEDFNDPGDTQEQMRSGSGIDSPVGTFRGFGDAFLYYEDQFGGAPCNDCGRRTATTTTRTTTTTDVKTISSVYHPNPTEDPNANPLLSYTQFDPDIRAYDPDTETGGTAYLGSVWKFTVDTSEDFNVNYGDDIKLTITNDRTQTSYTASLGWWVADYGNKVDFYILEWHDSYFNESDQFYIFDPLTLVVAVTKTSTVTTTEFETTPGVRYSKFPAVAGDGTIEFTLASSTTYRYLGFWWSAGSNFNNICLLPETGSTCIAEYNTVDLMANASFTKTGVRWPYWQDGRLPHYGNPRARDYAGAGACNDAGGTSHCEEPFAFIHIFQDSGFRRVQFTGDPNRASGFEFDNVTVSTAESWELIDLLPAGTLIGASTLPAYSVSSPSIIPLDPRSESVSFPGLLLGGAAANQPNASICVTEVDAGGTPVAADPSNLQISATVPAGVNSQSSAPRFAYSGARETIRDLSATIKINSATNSENVASSVSKYLRISVQARAGTGLTTCSGTNNVITAVIVELRPIRLNGSYIFGIPID